MGSDQGSSRRLDTVEIKSLIYREIGNQRAESYLEQLGRFFASRITKSEFDNFCIKTIGRQNIHLHNRLIRSIIKNASVAKSPPPSRVPKKTGDIARFGNAKTKSLYGESALLSPSSRKCRSRKFRDRPSPLGPLGKSQSITTQSATELFSLGSRPPLEVASVEEGEEVEQIAGSPSVQSRSPVTAPLGVSMNLRSRIARKTVSNVSTCQSSGELPDTQTLRSRLVRRLEMEGLKISMDSLSLLNNGLDAFMRKLIEPCLTLANTRSGNEQVRYAQQTRKLTYVSVSDFRAGMELNPQILGEDWSLHMEKICSRAPDE